MIKMIKRKKTSPGYWLALRWKLRIAGMIKTRNSPWVSGRLVYEFGKKKTAKILAGKYNLRLSDIVFIERVIKTKIISIATD